MKHFRTCTTLGLALAATFILVKSHGFAMHAQAPSQLERQAIETSSAPVFPDVFLRDVVVSNTDHDLKNTDKHFNSEPGIAIDPTHPRHIVVSAFSGAWTPLENGRHFRHAPIWYSRDGGGLWTRELSIPAPPGVPKGAVAESPCDETFAYGRDGVLYGTFLLNGNGEEGANCSSAEPDFRAGHPEASLFGEVYTGATSNPADPQSWRWHIVNGKTQPTNQYSPDQPWIVVNKDPEHSRDQDHSDREKVYVAYQSSAMQVAVADAKVPPDFTLDASPGPATSFGGNPGHRIAADHRSGAVYSLWETAAPIQCSSASAVSYMLNRSLDGGVTWELNGEAGGISIAQVCSHQNIYTYRFGEVEPGTILGGVNALRGGIDALTVDSKTGDVYVVYGEFDNAAGKDRISIVRLTPTSGGGMHPHRPHFVSGPKHQSALPAVAVADDEHGTIGVLYDTADRLDEATSRPYFSVHLAVSADHGAHFHSVRLQEFLFPENAPSGSSGPRPLGDYQQMKTVGKTFYGVFSGDGQPFGRPFHKIDPIFFKTDASCVP